MKNTVISILLSLVPLAALSEEYEDVSFYLECDGAKQESAVIFSYKYHESLMQEFGSKDVEVCAKATISAKNIVSISSRVEVETEAGKMMRKLFEENMSGQLESFEDSNSYLVINFDEAGAEKIARFSSKNIGKNLVFVSKGKVVSKGSMLVRLEGGIIKISMKAELAKTIVELMMPNKPPKGRSRRCAHVRGVMRNV